jgi:hypothetical protein
MDGFSPPPADFPVNLYLEPPADGTPTTGTLTAFPLASKALKQWLIDAGVSDPVVTLTARVTFSGVTDEGGKMETDASLGIELTNSGGGGPTPGTKPTVYVLKAADASKTGSNGAFTFIRSGSTSSSLTVNFAIDGSSTAVSGVDYVSIGTSVTIAAGSGTGPKTVSALSGGTSGRTLKINITDSSAYTTGSPGSATLSIID